MKEKDNKRIILGIDPGTAVTGFGVIDVQKTKMTIVDFGTIRPPSSLPLSERYWVIFRAIAELIERFQPEVMSVETQYIQKNPQSALKLGMARASAIIAAYEKGVAVEEISPTTAKKAVTGSGRAEKGAVQRMLQVHFGLSALPQPEDAADALALAFAVARPSGIRIKRV